MIDHPCRRPPPTWSALALATALALAASPVAAQQRAVVVDGDTIDVAGERIRVMGLDAPEMRARCPREARLARAATERMRKLTAGGVTLEPHRRDRYRRLLAVVRDRQSHDVADVLIREKLAVPYSGGRRQSWCEPS